MSDAKMYFTIKPFMTPNYAVMEMPPRPKQDGAQSLPSFHIGELDLETLDRLAEQWRRELYEKAGKPLPEDRK